MTTYGAYGSLNYEASDGTPGGVFTESGALRVTVVNGSTRTGLFAADGSINVVVEGTGALTPPGMFHPCGALRLRTAGTTFGVYAPNGPLFGTGVGYTHGADNIGASGLTVPVLTWTSNSSVVRPTFDLDNVVSPAVGDTFTFTRDGVDYVGPALTTTDLYDLDLYFSDIVPEWPNGTFTVWVKWTRGANYCYSNTVYVTIDVPLSAPNFTVDPVITYDAGVYTVTPGTVTGRLTPTVTRKWRRDGVDISPAETGLTYTKVAADEDHEITCYETATNASGTDNSTSNGITVSSTRYYFGSATSVNGGFGSGTLTVNSVNFGTFSGSRYALIAIMSDYNKATSLTVDGSGAGVTLLANSQVGANDDAMAVFGVSLTQGTHNLVFTGTSGNWSDCVVQVGTLNPALDSTPTDTVNPAWDTSGSLSITFMPGTTVPTNGVQLLWTKWAKNADCTFSNGTLEDYEYYANFNEAYMHHYSSTNDVRITATRTNTPYTGYIGLIFGP